MRLISGEYIQQDLSIWLSFRVSSVAMFCKSKLPLLEKNQVNNKKNSWIEIIESIKSLTRTRKGRFTAFVLCSRVRITEAKRRILLISRILSQFASCKLACTHHQVAFCHNLTEAARYVRVHCLKSWFYLHLATEWYIFWRIHSQGNITSIMTLNTIC